MRPIDPLELLRRRGYRGEIITLHRALRTLPLRRGEVGFAIAVSLGLLAIWIAVFNPVGHLWATGLRSLLHVLGVTGTVEIARHPVLGPWVLETPRLAVAAAAVSERLWWGGTVGCVVLLAISYLLPRRFLPLLYFLRLLVLLQASAQFSFRVAPYRFPYDIGGYTAVLFLAAAIVIGVVPLLYGATFSTLDFSRGKKILLPVLAMVYLVVFVPLQYLAHALFLHHASLLFMPLLFWTFGLPLDILAVIAFYAWGASWNPRPVLPVRGRRSPSRAWVLAAVLVGAILVPARARAQSPPRLHSVDAEVSYGRYTENLGHLDGEFVRYRVSRPFVDSWRLELGHAARFGDSGLGIGGSYQRNLRRDTTVSAGLSTGGGDVIFPDVRIDLGAEHGLLNGDPLVASLGYTHIESKAVNSSDGFGLGLRYYRGGFIGSVLGRLDIGQPGSTTTKLAQLGLIYGIYRRLYVGATYEFGDVSYVLVGPSEALVGFGSRGWTVDGTLYVRRDWGIGARVTSYDTDVYDLWSVTLRVFKEW
jgi:YaiO family outer membrane protein